MGSPFSKNWWFFGKFQKSPQNIGGKVWEGVYNFVILNSWVDKFLVIYGSRTNLLKFRRILINLFKNNDYIMIKFFENQLKWSQSWQYFIVTWFKKRLEPFYKGWIFITLKVRKKIVSTWKTFFELSPKISIFWT